MAGIGTSLPDRKLERIADRKVNGAFRIRLAGIQVVAIFDPCWSNDGAPAKTATDGVKSFTEWITLDVASQSHGVDKGDQGPCGSE